MLLQPTEFGKYVLVEELGVGGMARVYKAVRAGPMGFRKEVAIKQILPQAATDKKQIKALINEARLGGFLHHRNIVEVYEFDQVDDLYYIAMEFVDGYSLEQILRRIPLKGLLPPRIALAIALQICQGLGYAHSAEDDSGRAMHLVHRDLKPGNLMLDRRGVLKILDFGVARAETNLFTTQTVGMTKGTPAYMSPEQTTGERTDPIDRRSDLFSIGSLIAEVITGEVSFHATRLYEVLRKIADGDTGTVFERVRERLPEMEPVIRRALQPRPADRYSSAEEMGVAIQAIYDELPGDEEITPWLAEWMEGANPDLAPLARSEIELSALPGAPELSLDEEEGESRSGGIRWGLVASVLLALVLVVMVGLGLAIMALVNVTGTRTVVVGREVQEVGPEGLVGIELEDEPTPPVEEAPLVEADPVEAQAEGADDAVATNEPPAIVFTSSPPRADIHLGGRRIGRTAHRFDQGTPGESYRATLTKVGYQDMVVTAVYPASGSVTVNGILPRVEEAVEPATAAPDAQGATLAGDLPSAAEVVTPATVEFIVGSNAAVRDCFAQERGRGGTLPARLWVKFSVSPSGAISSTRVITEGFGGTPLETCMAGRINSLEFPEFAGSASKTAKYAFVSP